MGLLLQLPVVPAVAQVAGRTLCVHEAAAETGLGMHARPSRAAPVVARLPAGACGVTIAGRCADGWCEMALGAARGWVDTRHITVHDGPPPAAPGVSRPSPPPPVVAQGDADPGACVRGVERTDTLRLRTGPGVGYEAVGGIPSGACGVVRAGGCRGSWCQVSWQGRIGWVNASYLDPRRGLD